MEKYIWQNAGWPHFNWDERIISAKVGKVRHAQGVLVGKITTLGFDTELDTALEVMTTDLKSSSIIEGIVLDEKQIRSSVARQLGIDNYNVPVSDRYVDGVVDIMQDAVLHFKEPLTAERLWDWHRRLFPNGSRIRAGAWREKQEPMQVVSGAIGYEKIHYEAPPSLDVPRLMNDFIQWYNDDQLLDPVVKAAVAKLWFLCIHPFEDGNGRISRTLSDMLLCRSDNMTRRFYSLSATFNKYRNDYYKQLEIAQKGTMDVTDWVDWFLTCTEIAIEDTERIIQNVVEKNRFWQMHAKVSFNERQRKVLNRLLDGFEGKLTTLKWSKMTKTSTDTALRDIQQLVSENIVKVQGTGKGTFYELER